MCTGPAHPILACAQEVVGQRCFIFCCLSLGRHRSSLLGSALLGERVRWCALRLLGSPEAAGGAAAPAERKQRSVRIMGQQPEEHADHPGLARCGWRGGGSHRGAPRLQLQWARSRLKSARRSGFPEAALSQC